MRRKNGKIGRKLMEEVNEEKLKSRKRGIKLRKTR